MLLFKRAVKHSARVLYSDPEHKKAVTGLMKKIHVLDTLHSGVNRGTVGHKFNVNQSMTYIKQDVFKQKHTRLHTDMLMKILWPEVIRKLALCSPLVQCS